MSHHCYHGTCGFPPSGAKNETPTPEGPNSGGGEFYEYIFRSGTSSHPHPCPPTPAGQRDPPRVEEEARRLTAEATRVTAEAARLQEEITRLATENTRLATENTRLAAENTELREKPEDTTPVDRERDELIREARAITRVLPVRKTAMDGQRVMLINERVGSVSLDFWLGMSESQKDDLDKTLKRIVELICPTGVGWEDMAGIIQSELGRFGIHLPTADEYDKAQTASWHSVHNTALPDLQRVNFLLETSSQDCGKHVYVHEMILFLRELMGLRRGN